MPNPTIFPANLTFLGFAKEGATTYGTPAAAPAFWVPLDSPSWKPGQKQLPDEALRGDMAKLHGVVAGTRSDTMSYSTNLYLDTLYPHMLGVLGNADTVTGSADPWLHATALKNTGNAQPTSWTLWLFNGSECWQMAGSIVSKVEIDVKAEDAAKLQVEWMGLPATQVTTPTNTPSTSKMWPSWNTTITVAGTQATSYSDVKLSYTRECSVVQTADGTQAPYVIFVGPLSVGLDLNGVYQGYAGTPTDLSNLLTNGQPAFTVQVNPAGDTTHYAKWQHSTVAVDSDGAEVKMSAGKYVEITAKYSAVANATDALGGGQSPVKFSLANAVSAAY